MAIDLFHASTRRLRPETTLPNRPRQISDDKMQVESLFETHRPNTAPSRKTAVFLTRSLADCAVFLHAEYSSSANKEVPPLYYFRVTAIEHVEVPMVLVDHVAKLIRSELDAESAIREYWNPHLEWRWMECVATTCSVVEECDPPNFIEEGASRFRYMEDVRLAKNLFPIET